MRTHKVLVEIELEDRETVEKWLRNSLGSVKFSRIKSIESVEDKLEKLKKIKNIDEEK
jgi:hypothetical protein